MLSTPCFDCWQGASERKARHEALVRALLDMFEHIHLFHNSATSLFAPTTAGAAGADKDSEDAPAEDSKDSKKSKKKAIGTCACDVALVTRVLVCCTWGRCYLCI